jgi:hypothetical protein
MNFTENRTAFLAQFGEDVTIGGLPARGLWDDAYVDSLGVQSTGPAFSGFEADLPPHAVGYALVRGGITYSIAERQPDGFGYVVLRLTRQ